MISSFLMRLRSAGIVLFLSVILVPTFASAATVAEVFRVQNEETVLRGTFVRAAVHLLNIRAASTKQLPYKRTLPAELKIPIEAAYAKGALTIFGKELAPARGITRAEAAYVLMRLKDGSPKNTGVHFGDIDRGSDLEKAAQWVTEQKFMTPTRANFFGAKTLLKGSEAKEVLRKLVGEPAKEDSGTVRIPSVQVEFEVAKPSSALPNQDILRAVWQLLNEHYLHKEKLNGEEAIYKAAQALVESLKDPYTSFLPPVNAEQFETQLQGEVTGIGAQVEFKSNILTIVSPLPGSPAINAGLKPGDQIIKVDGVDITTLGPAEAISKVRGPKGSTAHLTIRRQGEELTIDVVRDTIKVPEIEISMQGSIAVVRLTQFGERTYEELRPELEKIQKKNPTGLVLDLRNNPGGLLDAASITLSAFLPKGSTVAKIRSTTERYAEVTTDAPVIQENVKIVVLVNGGSASASEIVAGALQDAKRATILGEKTFGKGTVQQVVDFRDKSKLKMTVAEWLTPGDHPIDGKGVTPDVLVKAADGGRDDQMLRALEILR